MYATVRQSLGFSCNWPTVSHVILQTQVTHATSARHICTERQICKDQDISVI